MAYKSRDEMFTETVRQRLAPGEVLQCVAYGESAPGGMLDGLLQGRGLAGSLVSQSLTKHYWLALTDRRVIVCGVAGFTQVLSQVDFVLGRVGGKVTLRKGLFSVRIEVQHPVTPFQATFIRTESGKNLAHAMAIGEALMKG